MRLGWAAAIGILLVLPTWTAAAASDRDLEADHVLGTGPLTPAICEGQANGTGGACFPVASTDEQVQISVDDEASLSVAAAWSLVSEGGIVYERHVFCDEALVTNPSPEDFPVDRLRVTILAPAFAEEVCSSMLAFGTQGTITASFTTG